MNTLEKGRVRTIIFKEKNVWIGVALEFNIVETGDDPREVAFMLDEAIRGYLKSAKKAKIGTHILNQKADAEFENLWKQLESKNPVKSPYQIYSFGRTILA